MKPVGIFIETYRGKITPMVLSMITTAKQKNIYLYGLLINEELTANKEILHEYGIDKIILITITNYNKYHANYWAESLIAVMKQYKIKSLVGLSRTKSRTILPLVAAQLEAPLAMRCISLDLVEQVVEKVYYSEKVVVKLKFKEEIIIYGLAQNLVDPKTNFVSGTDEEFLYLANIDPRIKYLGEIDEQQEETLCDADVVIAGGRGMKSKENFSILYNCANYLKAAVGASRVPVDYDWVPYSQQVGQTGFKISPKVYIGCGISGSIQHVLGMKTSKMIIVVNTDRHAAIIAHSDYYLVADLFKIIPLLNKKLREIRKK